MTWTFDSADPFAEAKDHVRVLIGDTTSTDESPSDEIINGFLVLYSDSIVRTAIESAKYIRARLAKKPQSRTAVGMTSTRTISEIDKVIADLQSRADAAGRGGVQVFGLTTADRDNVEDDEEFIRPFSGVGRDSIL